MLKTYLLATILVVASCFKLLENFNSFQKYKLQYNKKYSNKAVELYRFYQYVKNLQQIQRLNIEDEATGVYGQTQFTDWSKAEMKEILGVKIPKNFKEHFITNFTNAKVYVPRTDVPDIWNWVQQGAVTEIKNQGSCGSCWTFSTAGNIQSLHYLKTKELINLSEQQLIDCDKSNFGCNGGWPYNAIDWLSKNGGIMKNADYPLRSNYSGPCNFKMEKSYVNIKGYSNITHNETIIKDALYTIGPLSILLDFTGLFHYKAGVASPKLCSTWPDHALVLVGYGTKDEDYWLIKNSWGPKWGQNGYLMLKRGQNKCGISNWATTAVLQ